MFKFERTLNTAGDGYWSDAVKTVKTTKLTVPYISDDEDFGELCVYFNTKTWNCDEDGLIYTDSLFLTELRKELAALGLAADDVDYSEQGMQEHNYVSLDVGEAFIKSWVLLHEPLYKMVKDHKAVDAAAA